ncbi:hypothetical protein C6P40_004244 [Pichia californica]|uniref:Inositol polyphosphate-related phosphatase domain-containing protein n=1 Tax=Pichia californica TaxID=460514 RepID=A0A9P7BGD3_9ASCO|nr:hypothetical protein C6P42_004868 [[Candida] californica]KAG0689896.1 hypothetical protein C6P40_004244 [[Candida] californica]
MTQIFISTFNCGKKPPIGGEFPKHISEKLPNDISSLYVFGFQEISSILESTNDNEINKKLIWISNNLLNCLEKKFKMKSFELISINHFGSIGIIIISPFKSKISNIILSFGYPVGHFLTNLKGGIGVRIKFESVEFTFVCMHLNAGEKIENLIRRNNDIYNILSKLKFDDGWCVLKPESHIFLFGDLNYRLTGTFGMFKSIVISNEGNNIEEIFEDLKNDELLIMMKNGTILEDFEEAKINFKPSYKYIIGSGEYNKKRIPSYCDRILYLGYSEFSKLPKYEIIKYDSIPECQISDHIPVYLIINVHSSPPERNINDLGYLIDRTTELNEFSKNYKLVSTSNYILKLSYFTTYLMGLGLYLTITNKGRMISFGILCIVYILIKWNGIL